MEENLERVWKHFGKNTNAGKLLYDLYGIRYKPEQHINYPELKKFNSKNNFKKQQEDKETKEKRAKSSAIQRIQNIDYPDLRKKYVSKYSKVDFIPKRKNEQVIRQEIEKEKIQILKNSQMKKNFSTNRKLEIEKLQDNFQYQERMVMPKGARLPGIKSEQANSVIPQSSDDLYNINENDINLKNYRKILDKKEELNFLYNSIIKEIDERYAHMEEMKKIGKNVDERIMNEIRERLDELKKLKKIMNEQDK